MTREQSAALTNANEVTEVGPYRVYFAYGKWRVSHGGSSQFIFSVDSKEGAVGFAEGRRKIFADDGFTMLPHVVEARQRENEEIMRVHRDSDENKKSQREARRPISFEAVRRKLGLKSVEQGDVVEGSSLKDQV